MRIAMLLHKSVEFDSRVRREASALAAAGHEVCVLELAAVPEGAAQLDGFRRHSVMPAAWTRRRLPRTVYRPLMLLWFVRGALRLRPDVIHAHDAAMLLPATIGARLTGARLVYDSHELAASVPYRERGWAGFVSMIERAVVPRCAAVITVSDGIAARLQQSYRLSATPTVVRNVSALERRGAGGLRRRLGLGPDAPLVLHQGAPAPARGCEVLVDAVARLDGVHLVFLGDPEPGYREALDLRIRRSGIVDRVSMLPSIPLGELLANTAEADVGVTLLQDTCENHRLALPNKLFEYIAAGVPVVASALPETKRLVERYGVGRCVAPGDVDSLASALHLALEERGDARMDERLAHAADQLRWSRERERLLALYGWLDSAARSCVARSVSPPLVVQLVRNAVSNDARVLRAARTAQRSGARALVLGVSANGVPTGESMVSGVPVIRLDPWGRLSALRGPRGGAPAVPAREPRPAGPEDRPSRSSRLGIRTRLRRMAAGSAFTIRAVALARREHPAIVHANDWNTMLAGAAIKLALGSRLIYDSHELWPDRNGRWERRAWLIACEAVFVRLADELLVTSPGHGAVIAARYRVSPPRLIRNIPEDRAAEPSEMNEPPTIVYVGGLMPGRGLEQMIDALALLPGVGLRAIGPGSPGYRSQLLGRAERSAVAERVALAGPVAPGEVLRLLRGALCGLCLIQPGCLSYEQSLPNKLFEYVAAGLPVLASDLPVIADVVHQWQLGVVVAPRDTAAIAAGVRRLLDPSCRDRTVAHVRSFARANPWASEAELLADVYRRLCGAPRRATY